MADKESLKVLSQGVKIWNKWRKENHNELIDLRGFSLSGDILIGADFSYVDFGHSNFDEVNLSEANLSASFLHGAILNKVDFSKACLADVFFRRSELVDVNFSGADLNDAILQCNPRRLNFCKYRPKQFIWIRFSFSLRTLNNWDGYICTFKGDNSQILSSWLCFYKHASLITLHMLLIYVFLLYNI